MVRACMSTEPLARFGSSWEKGRERRRSWLAPDAPNAWFGCLDDHDLLPRWPHRRSVPLNADTEPRYRRGTADDALACHELMWSSVTDLGRRQGTPLEGTAAEWWPWLEPVNRLLV